MRYNLNLGFTLATVFSNFITEASANTRIANPEWTPSLPFQTPQHPRAVGDDRSYATRLRDILVHKLWGPSPKCKKSGNDGKRGVFPSTGRRGSKIPSPEVLARYGSDVVLRFRISTEEEARALSDAVNVLFLDVWESTAFWADIRLSKDVVPLLLGLLPDSMQTTHKPLMHDLALTIYESYPSPLTDDLPNPISFAPSTSFSPIRKVPDDALPSPQNVFFQNYQPLSVINPWLNLLASLFSTHVTLINIGTTAEGRSIHGLRVGVHPKVNSSCTSLPRKTIVITGGAHAREWISVSTVNYVAYTLITSYGKPKHSTKDLLETFDFVFIPTLNPDGYVYTWENDRLWRKSRQDTNLRFCPGLDLDRSFGFEWDNAATSSNPCSESFSGEGPFEAVEAKAFAEWVRNETATGEREIIAFLDLHSYSQQVLYPYSFSCSEVPAGWEDLMEVGMGFAKAVRRERGGVYGVTSACEGSVSIMGREVSNDPTAEVAEKKRRRMWPKLEAGGGSALDWMYHEVHVRYAYQIKLRDTGAWGFLLPPKEIVPTGKEVWAAVHWFGEYLLGNKGIESESNDFLNEETESPESIYLKPMEEPEEVNRDGTNHGNAEEGMENKGSPWEL